MDTSRLESGGGLREELRGDATTLADTAKGRLHSEINARKGGAVTQAQNLSSALDKAAGELNESPDWLKSAFRQGAQTLQRLAESIEGKDSRALTRDVQLFARANPTTFLAGCAVAGFAAARVMKAGTEDVSSGASASGQKIEPYSATPASGKSASSGLDIRQPDEGSYTGGIS